MAKQREVSQYYGRGQIPPPYRPLHLARVDL